MAEISRDVRSPEKMLRAETGRTILNKLLGVQEHIEKGLAKGKQAEGGLEGGAEECRALFR